MRPENRRGRHNTVTNLQADSESEKGGAHVGCTVLLGENRMTKCPQCGEAVIQTNLGGGKTDDYCEECGWPDEDRRHPADPVKCLQQGYRLLRRGDITRATDEFLRGHDWEWVKLGEGRAGWQWDKKHCGDIRRKTDE